LICAWVQACFFGQIEAPGGQKNRSQLARNTPAQILVKFLDEQIDLAGAPKRKCFAEAGEGSAFP
jgi:hypothetical protein